MVAGHQRDAVRWESCIMEDRGEMFELGLLAHFREVARDDQVVCTVLFRDSERSCQAATTPERVDLATEAHQCRRQSVAYSSGAGSCVEDVNVGEVSDAPHRYCLSKEEAHAPPSLRESLLRKDIRACLNHGS